MARRSVIMLKVGPTGSLKCARRDPQWLEDVDFRQTHEGVFVTGTVVQLGQVRPRRKDWSRVTLDLDRRRFCCRSQDVVGARYARFSSDGGLHVMGADVQGMSARLLRSMPLYAPERAQWTGNMSGINYLPAEPSAVQEALRLVWDEFPGAIVLDGTDDWFAPAELRPELFVERFDVRAVARWHTGASGKSTSGIILTKTQFARLNRRYRDATGMFLQDVPSARRPQSHSRCGCWDGSAFRIYRPASRMSTLR